ncbi:TfoX/Sxy family protein [Abyssibius alkaniclasticus]|uniref:TfoX/Sxy family protein n=1 Tax=Abyssibius alkaniclasticus TaxID=2881234 RepID=UPI0023635837|nr:TfoX/Sxy family protein [Abyssibius alkaniclasticus]UPH70505.1 TfoX/Sxy family protein [Abyssibius alkaniclasticus]
MPYDETLAEAMRADLAGHAGISEKKMFGGLCFLLNGHMVCGVHKGGGMYRVGKANEAAARAIPGARPLGFTGRPMGGMIEVDEAGLQDGAYRRQWLGMALSHAASLPPKTPKP